VNQPQLLGLSPSVFLSILFGVSVNPDQVMAVRTVDKPGEALLTRKGGVADRPASSVKDEKEFVSFGDVDHGRTT
jgi:hypothetical protein